MPITNGDVWIGTHTGRKFSLFNPSPKDIDAEDIAHGLSNICRYGGQHALYTVAEHSVWVSKVTAPEDAVYGLLHDAAEAYVGDMVRPLKGHACMATYREVEDNILRVVAEAFGLESEYLVRKGGTVAGADQQLFMCEVRDLLPPSLRRAYGVNPNHNEYPHLIMPMTSKKAKEAFLDRLALVQRWHVRRGE